MENIRTKRAKKPNPKYADSDYETIAALRRPTKQAKLERRSSLLSEKETPSHDGTMNSASSASDEEDDSVTHNDTADISSEDDIKVVEIKVVEDIKVEVGDADDEALPISNGNESPDSNNPPAYKNDEVGSEISKDPPSIQTADLSNVNGTGSPEIEKIPSAVTMSTLLRTQVITNHRLDKIENQISKILEILQKKQKSSSPSGQLNINRPITKIRDPDVKNNLKKKSNK